MERPARVDSPVRRLRGSLLAGAALFAGFAVAGCNTQLRSGARPPSVDDGGGPGGSDGGGFNWGDGGPGSITPCGDTDPSCTSVGFGPPQMPFPLSGDPQPDPNETDTGVQRDPNGYLILGATHASFDFIYTANTDDWGAGTVSKINSKTVREVARYFSVTCYSNPGGGRGACDGTNGCCTRDDYARYQQRAQGQNPGGHQPVQLNTNYPSRTAVDFNGDVWVANRAFGGQSSVTKIANDIGSCVDRNGVPGIQTSSDVNNDGTIDTDCNRNGVPDDVADVMNRPCANGKAQEFYGYDDDCVLFTTNTNVNNMWGRPLALGQGAVDFGPADAWAGTFMDGKFFRVDGTTGQIKTTTQVSGTPYGAAIDQQGILWAPTVASPPLSYFDTKNPATVGTTRNYNGPYGAYGIGMDRDQNVWLGGYPTANAYRYTPDRSNGDGNLGKGYWTMVQNPGVNNGAGGCQGRGIAADSRTPQQYWVWMACHGAPYIVRIDGNIPLPQGQDQVIDGSNYPAIRIAGGAICGAGVDVQQNVWGVASSGAFATRIKVDMNGNPTAPMLDGSPGNGCPIGSGDYCTTVLNGVDPNITSYTYSDFSGFGLRNFTNPSGEWTYVQKGCDAGDTKWMNIQWDADVPPNTTLSVRVRSGNTPTPDMSWGMWTGTFTNSPGDFNGVLSPNNPAKYVQVKFDLSTMDKASTPRLKSFKVNYECLNIPG